MRHPTRRSRALSAVALAGVVLVGLQPVLESTAAPVDLAVATDRAALGADLLKLGLHGASRLLRGGLVPLDAVHLRLQLGVLRGEPWIGAGSHRAAPTATALELRAQLVILLDETGELELGYSVMRPFWGRGYASEAAGALLDWIYRMVPVDHVIGFAVAENMASRRVLEKAGMAFTGLRDLHGIPNAFYRHDRPA